LPEPPARISPKLAVNLRGVLPAGLEPGPWILRGEVLESGAAITVAPASRPEAMCGVWEAQVRAHALCGSFPRWMQAPHKWIVSVLQPSPLAGQWRITIQRRKRSC
jgi:hypothetical protein